VETGGAGEHRLTQRATASGGAIGWTGAAATVSVVGSARTTGGVTASGFVQYGLLRSLRFRLGDRIFFRLPSTDRYLPERVRGIYYINGAFWYDCHFGELIPERDVLLPDEYRLLLDQIARRHRKLVRRLPTY
jgi:hypothetical protein